MNTFQKKQNLLELVEVFPLDQETRSVLLHALREKDDEETLNKVVTILKSRAQSFKQIAELMEQDAEAELKKIEEQLQEAEKILSTQ